MRSVYPGDGGGVHNVVHATYPGWEERRTTLRILPFHMLLYGDRPLCYPIVHYSHHGRTEDYAQRGIPFFTLLRP